MHDSETLKQMHSMFYHFLSSGLCFWAYFIKLGE